MAVYQITLRRGRAQVFYAVVAESEDAAVEKLYRQSRGQSWDVWRRRLRGVQLIDPPAPAMERFPGEGG